MTTETRSQTTDAYREASRPRRFMTLIGLPVAIEIAWPFHPATAGSDFDVVHGRLTLEDGSGMHADLSVQITQVIKEALPSLEPEDAFSAVINAVRKDLDRKQLELVKSGKRQPVPVSSRHYDFKHKRLYFNAAGDQEIADFLRRKVYWLHQLEGTPVPLAEPLDVEYLNTTAEHLLALAEKHLHGPGLIALQNGAATPADKLLARSSELETEMRQALQALEEKHRFEKEGATHH